MRVSPVTCLAALTIALAVSPVAAQKKTLPQGRPFQILQQQIGEVHANQDAQIAALQSQLAALEGRLDAVEQKNTVQDQLIGLLQASVADHESRLTANGSDIAAIQAWQAAAAGLATQLFNRIQTLENTVAVHGSSLANLLNLHNTQQLAINAIGSQIAVLEATTGAIVSTNATQQASIATLQASLNSLTSNFNATRQQLAAGCPVNSYVRVVPISGAVICQQDAGQGTQVVDVSAGTIIASNTTGVATAVCPPSPLGGAPWIVTGGGHALGETPNLAVIASGSSGSNSWSVIVKNSNPNFAAGIVARAQCLRNVP